MTDQRRLGTGIPGADSDDECDRQVVESFGEVGEKAQRAIIRPRQIVNQYRHRTLLGKVDNEPVEAVQNAEFVCGLTVAEHTAQRAPRVPQQHARSRAQPEQRWPRTDDEQRRRMCRSPVRCNAPG